MNEGGGTSGTGLTFLSGELRKPSDRKSLLTLRVTVVDGQGGTLPGVAVHIQSGEEIVTAESDSEGALTAKIPRQNNCLVTLTADGAEGSVQVLYDTRQTLMDIRILVQPDAIRLLPSDD